MTEAREETMIAPSPASATQSTTQRGLVVQRSERMGTELRQPRRRAESKRSEAQQ